MILYLHPFAGVSGDMLLGALIELGTPVAGIEAAVTTTGLTGWRLRADRVVRHGLTGTKAEVLVEDDVPARTAAQLLDYAGQARPEPAARVAREAISLIAGAEADLHGADPDEVHLHEIGGLDTVVDTVGTAAAMHLLGVDEVVSAPLALGCATVETAHGRLPAPAPATLALLRGAAVAGIDTETETVTPTGAALLRAMSAHYRPIPAMTVHATGYGAGSRDLPDRPNLLQATLGEPPNMGPSGEDFVTLETNVDDTTGETLGHLIGAALRAGAADAWASPIVMKKGRPAHTVHVLCRREDTAELEELVLAHTGSLGLRRTGTERRAVPRQLTTVHVRGHAIRVKHGPWRSKPEHEDVARAAEALDLPPHAIADAARRKVEPRPTLSGPEEDTDIHGRERPDPHDDP